MVLRARAISIFMKSDYVEVDGYRFHYYRDGDQGPKIVLLHGLSSAHSALNWKPFIKSTHQDYQLLALDLIGLGKTSDPKEPMGLEKQAELIQKALNKIGFNEYSLIGYSWGAALAYRLASLYPKAVQKLVLVDFTPQIHDDPKHVDIDPTVPFKFESKETAIRCLEEKIPYSFTPMWGKLGGDGFWDDNLGYFLEEDENGVWSILSHASRQKNLIHDGNGWKYFENIRCPTLFIRGSESHLALMEDVEKMKDIMTDLKIITVEGAGHALPDTHRKEFEKAIRDFIPFNSNR